jgi:L-seryl-tRNA(Ser) seleniumtransferase
VDGRSKDRPLHLGVEPARMSAAAGGGTLPVADIPSAGIAVKPLDCSPDALAGRLRSHRPPIVGRVDGEALLLDLRTVRSDQDAALADALCHVAVDL